MDRAAKDHRGESDAAGWANVTAEMHVRIWENFSTRAGAYREGLKVSQIPQDVGWVAVEQKVVAKGSERERGLYGEGRWEGRDGCLTATDKSQRAPVLQTRLKL